MQESLGKKILEATLQKAEVTLDQHKAKTSYPRILLKEKQMLIQRTVVKQRKKGTNFL
jgi:hypothetical protein